MEKGLVVENGNCTHQPLDLKKSIESYGALHTGEWQPPASHKIESQVR